LLHLNVCVFSTVYREIGAAPVIERQISTTAQKFRQKISEKVLVIQVWPLSGSVKTADSCQGKMLQKTYPRAMSLLTLRKKAVQMIFNQELRLTPCDETVSAENGAV